VLSADILNLLLNPIMWAKIQLQSTAKQLQQDLKANLRDCWIISAFRELISNERIWIFSASHQIFPRGTLTLRPSNLIPAKHHALLPECFSNQIPPLGRNMIILYPMDHSQLGLELSRTS
jgi:hypothetical protein